MEYDLEDAPIQPPAPPPPKPNDDWRRNPKYLAICGISAHEVFTRTGQIEPAVIPRGGAKTQGGPSQKQTKVFLFGKYKGRAYDWVKENDLQYWEWVVLNIKGFKP